MNTKKKKRFIVEIIRLSTAVFFVTFFTLLNIKSGICSSQTEYFWDKDILWSTTQYDVGYDSIAQWLADVNGDGKADYIYNKEGTKEQHVMLSNGSSFGDDTNWGSRKNGAGYDGKAQWVADVNGDGKADFIYNNKGTKEQHVMLSDGSSFGDDTNWGSRNDGVGHDGRGEWVVDVNGDKKADYIYNKEGTKELHVMLSNGSSFGDDTKWGSRDNTAGYEGRGQWMADVNGDGKADYIYNKEGTKEQHVMLSNGSSFGDDTNWGSRLKDASNDGKGQWMADINGDGKADFMYYNLPNIMISSPNVYVMISNGQSFEAEKKMGTFEQYGVNLGFDTAADVNGDGFADGIGVLDKKQYVKICRSRNPSTFTMMITGDPQYDWGGDDLSKTTNTAQIKAMNEIEGIKNWPDNIGGDSVVRPMGVIINGDLTNFFKENQLSKFTSWFATDLNYLIFPGLGNHDYKNNVKDCTCPNYYGSDWVGHCVGEILNDNYCAEKAVDFMQDLISSRNLYYFDDSFVGDIKKNYDKDSVAYAFDIGNIHFVQLNLAPNYQKDSIDIKSSFGWLTTNLQEAYEKGMKSVINMHAYDSEFMDADNPDFLAAINGKNVIAVFAGHYHDEFGYKKNVPNTNIPFFRTGAPVSGEDKNSDIKYKPIEKFLLVEFTDSYFLMGVIDYNSGTPVFMQGPSYMMKFMYSNVIGK